MIRLNERRFDERRFEFSVNPAIGFRSFCMTISIVTRNDL